MRVVVLSGAGISAESGLKTFRDSDDGLWNNYKIEEVCSIKGWHLDPTKVNDFYNMRRIDVINASPNEAHLSLAAYQQDLDLHIITTNIDDLHERAGSTNVLHLHGNVLKARSSKSGLAQLNDYLLKQHLVDIGKEGIKPYQEAEDRELLRPHVVFFGEPVPNLPNAIEIVSEADHLIIVGTSLNVSPANTLMAYAKETCTVHMVNPVINNADLHESIKIYPGTATEYIPIILKDICT